MVGAIRVSGLHSKIYYCTRIDLNPDCLKCTYVIHRFLLKICNTKVIKPLSEVTEREKNNMCYSITNKSTWEKEKKNQKPYFNNFTIHYLTSYT